MAMSRLEKKAKDERRRVAGGATALEEALWQKLGRIVVDGEPFVRQVVIGPYLADFVSHKARLIVEIDGAQHYRPDQMARDTVRDAWLGERGYLVLRFPNTQVRDDPAAVLDSIGAVVEERRQLPPANLPIATGPIEGKRCPRRR